MKLAQGIREDGVVIGNVFDKYASGNPIVKWMMAGFETALSDFVTKVAPSTIHEIGCGEGFWVLKWHEQGIQARGSDFSSKVIELARENAIEKGIPTSLFTTRSIYELTESADKASLVVCCEVLEHLEKPETALQKLTHVVEKHLIVSVPREPLWRTLNVIRGKYPGQLGNTPGHIQHWSKKDFIRLIKKYFDIVEIKSPLPWTMLLCRPYPSAKSGQPSTTHKNS